MNIIQLAGRLGNDVETRFLPDGTKVSTLRVATNIRRGGKEETTWWRVTLWGDRFDKMIPYFTKGSSLIVVGEFVKAETYTDRNGNQQVSLEVRAEFVRFNPFGKSDRPAGESRASGESGGEYSEPGSEHTGATSRGTATPAAGQPIESYDEDVPF